MVGASTYWDHRSQTAAELLYAAQRLPQASDEQVAKLEDVASGYARTPSGQEAMMMLGDLYFTRKDFDKTIEKFKLLAGRSRNRPILLIAALHKLAEAQIASGDAVAAADTYLKAAADPHNAVASVSRVRAAASLEKAGELEKAATLYRQVIEDANNKGNDADRSMRDLSEERLIWLIANRRIQG